MNEEPASAEDSSTSERPSRLACSTNSSASSPSEEKPSAGTYRPGGTTYVANDGLRAAGSSGGTVYTKDVHCIPSRHLGHGVIADPAGGTSTTITNGHGRVAAPVVDERMRIWGAMDGEHPTDDDVMVTSGMHGNRFALERRNSGLQHGQPVGARLPADGRELVVHPTRKDVAHTATLG